MSKQVKNMQIAALKHEFGTTRDFVVMSINKLDNEANGSLRTSLRKKNIKLRVVKNSLARKVLVDLGLNVTRESPLFAGMTILAYGASSVSELSREVESELKGAKTAAKYKNMLIVKGALADGQPVTFEQALKMPTRLEAIGRVVSLAMAPAARLVSQIKAPGANLSSQIKSLSEKGEETPAVEVG